MAIEDKSIATKLLFLLAASTVNPRIDRSRVRDNLSSANRQQSSRVAFAAHLASHLEYSCSGIRCFSRALARNAGKGRKQEASEAGSGRPPLGEKRRPGLGLNEPKAKRARVADDAGAAATAAPGAGAPRRADHAAEQGPPAERPVYSDQCTAFVKSIAGGTSDDELQAVFAGCGELRGLRHMRDSQGETRVRNITGTLIARPQKIHRPESVFGKVG